MLAPRNECGMRKFICTSLRPTQLPYQELYDFDKAALFVSDFITYEPLELATSLPQHMPSTSAVIGWQAGDAFDIAQLLTSILLGVGYDAYVVSGYARGAITRCDRSGSTYNIDKNPVEKPAEMEASPQKYAVAPRLKLESTFQKNNEREAASRQKGPPTLTLEQVRALEQRAGNEAEELDELKGQRVHAWVMLLAGKRLLEHTTFIEPSTGKCYSAEEAPYYAIESVWNSANYWVNLQERVDLADLSVDLNANGMWERLLFDATTVALDADVSGDARGGHGGKGLYREGVSGREGGGVWGGEVHASASEVQGSTRRRRTTRIRIE